MTEPEAAILAFGCAVFCTFIANAFLDAVWP